MTHSKPTARDLDAALDVLLLSWADALKATNTDALTVLLSKTHSIDRKGIEQLIVDELRARKQSWTLIADLTNTNPTAAFARYSPPKKTSSGPTVTAADLPGMSVRSAADEADISTQAIYDAMRRNDPAPWWTTVPTEGKRKEIRRILDLDGLRSAVPRKRAKVDPGSSKNKK